MLQMVIYMQEVMKKKNNERENLIKYNLKDKLEYNGMCIVWDSGSIPGSLKHLTALAAAKFLDPAS